MKKPASDRTGDQARGRGDQGRGDGVNGGLCCGAGSLECRRTARGARALEGSRRATTQTATAPQVPRRGEVGGGGQGGYLVLISATLCSSRPGRGMGLPCCALVLAVHLRLFFTCAALAEVTWPWPRRSPPIPMYPLCHALPWRRVTARFYTPGLWACHVACHVACRVDRIERSRGTWHGRSRLGKGQTHLLVTPRGGQAQVPKARFERLG